MSNQPEDPAAWATEEGARIACLLDDGLANVGFFDVTDAGQAVAVALLAAERRGAEKEREKIADEISTGQYLILTTLPQWFATQIRQRGEAEHQAPGYPFAENKEQDGIS